MDITIFVVKQIITFLQERHQNRQQYFKEQGITTSKYVIPFIEKYMAVNSNVKVLEIGCGEGGNMAPFVELGCKVVGVDINESRLKLAKEYFEEIDNSENLELIYKNIYELTFEDIGRFDLIIMRDVIEHIPDQEKFLNYVKQFFTTDGMLFMGFPPFYMPFGGHQQVLKNKFLSKLPYFHILPKPIYGLILKVFKIEPHVIASRMEIKDTGITIERLDKILKQERFKIKMKQQFLINPNYEIKFGMKPRRQFALLSAIPFLRNFVTTCCYYLVAPQAE